MVESVTVNANGHAGGKSDEGGEQGTEFWPPFLGYRIKITDSLLVLFTAVLAIVTTGLWISTHRLWKAGESQLTTAKAATDVARAANEISRASLVANERAWLSAEIADWSDLRFYPAGSGEIKVTIQIRNFGKSPALNVHTTVTAAVRASTAPNVARAWAAKNRNINVGYSRMLLPRDSYRREFGVTIEGFKGVVIDNDTVKSGFYHPAIIACVTYQTLPDLSVHQTVVCYSISHKIGGRSDEPGRLLRTGDDIVRAGLQLDATSGGFAD